MNPFYPMCCVKPLNLEYTHQVCFSSVTQLCFSLCAHKLQPKPDFHILTSISLDLGIALIGDNTLKGHSRTTPDAWCIWRKSSSKSTSTVVSPNQLGKGL